MPKALNRMRERITGLMDERTKMLAAISHDLRTPITRMRLRSEFIQDEAHRSRMLATSTRYGQCWSRCCPFCATTAGLRRRH